MAKTRKLLIITNHTNKTYLAKNSAEMQHLIQITGKANLTRPCLQSDSADHLNVIS